MKVHKIWEALRIGPVSFVPALSLVLILLTQGCTSLPTNQAKGWLSDQLYFGLSRKGVPIPESAWQDFLDQVVSPEFPDGFTVWKAQGQWKDAAGMVEKEPSRVLEIVHPVSSDYEARIQDLIQSYKRRFQQDSVLRLQSPLQASF